MYIPPAIDLSRSIIENQKLFEKILSKDLNVSEKDKVLDLGCGRGRIAIHISKLTGANLYGLNIDNDQVQNARKFASIKGLSKQCTFVEVLFYFCIYKVKYIIFWVILIIYLYHLTVIHCC